MRVSVSDSRGFLLTLALSISRLPAMLVKENYVSS